MFPYLKKISDFIKDCESVDTELTKKCSTGRYEFVSLYNPNKNTNCHSCNIECERCKGIPAVITDLMRNVDASNWGSDISDGIGTVSFSEVRAWCQSICVALYEVLKPLENTDLVIGLEYYLETRKGFGKDKQNHYRVDVMIGGYGLRYGNPEPRLLVIEQKQYSDIRWKKDGKELTWFFDSSKATVESPCHQVRFYCDNIRASLDNGAISPYSLYPCVFMHNMNKENAGADTYDQLDMDQADGLIVDKGVMFEGRPVNIFISGSNQKDRYRTLRNHILEIFDYKGNDTDAADVFRILKKEYCKLSQEELGNILVCRDEDIETKFKSILRPDQFFAMYGFGDNKHWDNYLKNHIDFVSFFKDRSNRDFWAPEGYGITDMIEGGPGSGKTILAMLILRYCLARNLSVLYVYSGSAPVNRIFGYLADVLSEQTEGKTKGGRNTFVESVNSLSASTLKNFKLFKSYKDGKKFDIVGFNKIPENMDYDVYIIDDAHIDKETYFKTRKTPGSAEILKSLEDAKKLIFILYDKHQIIYEPNKGSDGSKEKAYYDLLNELATVNPDKNAFTDHNSFHLWSMFRCNGNEGYLTWIEKVLGISSYDKKKGLKLFDFDVQIIDKTSLQKIVSDIKPDDDVLIMSELFSSDTATKILGRKAVIYSGENGLIKTVGETGEINLGQSFKVRGIETGTAIVIIDDRLKYEDGKVTGPDDLKMKYRILLTRGLKKCIIYAMDENLSNYLRKMLK